MEDLATMASPNRARDQSQSQAQQHHISLCNLTFNANFHTIHHDKTVVDQLWQEMSTQFQLPIGETTLEELIASAGAVVNGTGHPQHVDWVKFQQQVAVEGSAGFDGSREGQMAVPVSSSCSPAEKERKRRYPETVEKSIERRQKRMIKNRESAARSRARKQAYTHQLEVEVNRLRTTNSWLKTQKEVDTMLFSETSVLPKYQLRRTSSASF